MNNLLQIVFLLVFSLSIFAQIPDKELENWDKPQYRRYKPGEEVKAMIQAAERRDKSPHLRQRVPLVTNADILQMKKAQFTDGTIISLIQARQSWFDLSPEALIVLKGEGISETIINAMIEADRENTSRLIPTDKRGLPTDIGIYVLQDDSYVEIDAEPISWKDGGIWKHIVTFGLTRGHINAKAMSPRSRYAVARNTDIILRTPEGVAASEYVLVQLYEKDNRREFRLLTGGIMHESSGTERTSVNFTYHKIAPRTYAVNVGNLPSGEFGFLPTFQMNPTNAAFVGKLYAFSID